MKKLISLLLAMAMVCGLAACGTDTQQTGDTAGETYVFTDDCGREVTVPQEVSRIVPSGPLAQMVLFAIAPEKIAGLATKWYDSAEGIIAEEYLELPYFGQLYGSADLNVEELALAEPQLIIDIGAPQDGIVEDMDTLQQQTNIPAVFVSADLESMPQTFRALGGLLDKETKAEELAQFCERVYDRTVAIMAEVGADKVDALYVLGEQGLNVLASGSYHAELIDMLTNNVAVVDNLLSKGTGNEVSMEQIALWDPDFVLFAPDSIYETVADMDVWGEVSAIAGGNYIEVPDAPHNWMGMPPSVQRYLGLIWLTAELYPEYCDYDVKAEIMEYYQLFYGCRLTDEQYAGLTANAFLD